MKSVRAWLMRLSGVFATKRSERELSAEIESHLQLHIDDNVRAGMTPAEARRRAVIALGGVEGTKEAYRDRRGLPAFESMLRDVRYGIRSLIKAPGFALAGIVILGLGIGVNTAIFTVVNAVVLKPLPFADADRIMRVWHTPPQGLFTTPIFALSPGNFIDWEAQNQSFERMAIYRSRPHDADRTGRSRSGDDPARLGGFSADSRRDSHDRPRLHEGRRSRRRLAQRAVEQRVLSIAFRRRSIGDRQDHPAESRAVHGDRHRAGHDRVRRPRRRCGSRSTGPPRTRSSGPITTTAASRS